VWQIVPAGLVVACSLALVARDDRRGGLVNVLALNWCACSIGSIVTGDTYPALWFAVADYLSALAILVLLRMSWGEGSLAETIVAIIYAAQLVCHGWQLNAIDPVQAKYSGWFFLLYAGLAQLAAAIVWIGHGFYRRHDLPRRGLARPHVERGGVSSACKKGTR